MKKIEMEIECPSCRGTGLYSGMGEGTGTAVVCYKCKGTGKYKYSYSYNEFTGRKTRSDVNRVYLKGYGYKLGLGKINFANGIGEIDMDKEGISYQEFLNGKIPEHIKTIACPMVADQGACHEVEGFTDKCFDLHGGWVGHLPSCNYQPNKAECWKRFYSSK